MAKDIKELQAFVDFEPDDSAHYLELGFAEYLEFNRVTYLKFLNSLRQQLA
jgi:hypothetical protein